MIEENEMKNDQTVEWKSMLKWNCMWQYLTTAMLFVINAHTMKRCTAKSVYCLMQCVFIGFVLNAYVKYGW